MTTTGGARRRSFRLPSGETVWAHILSRPTKPPGYEGPRETEWQVVDALQRPLGRVRHTRDRGVHDGRTGPRHVTWAHWCWRTEPRDHGHYENMREAVRALARVVNGDG